ncbi:Uncharacterized protein APZ42_029750, partial [Daphnia magna]
YFSVAATMTPKAFKPYGTPPPFDFDEYKDSFELWQRQWSIFMALSTINTSLPQTDRSSYTANILLSCLSKPTLRAICSMGLSDIELGDPDIIIAARPSQQDSQRYSRGPPAGAPPNGCWNCGAESFHQRSECPANGKECGCCGKIGHFKKVCSKNTPKPETAGSIIIGSIMTGELLEADVSPAGSDSRVTVSFLPDTGASIDAIPHQLYEQLFSETPLHRAPRQTANDPSSLITMHVLKDLRQPVLSKATQKKLGVLPLDYPYWCVQSIRINVSPQQKAEMLKSLMAPHPLIFDGVCRPMAGPPCHFQLLKTELDSLEDQLVICKVVDPTAWVQPIVIAPKKDGGIRVCVDFTHLNNFIIRPKFETATPFQAVRTIPAGMKFFTVIDAFKGYHQVPLDDESAAMTTFSTPFGRYIRRVSAVFDDLPNCHRIIEDILIFSETYEEHVALPSVLFGGYILSSTGFSPNPELLSAISKFPALTNITEMRAFHGLCQQMGNFSQSLAATLLPLTPLLKK